MSKYIKLEDALEQAKRGTNNYYICKAIESLPTIEVSEDCISRDWVYNALTKVTAVTPTQIDMLSDFTDIIKNAPSVVSTQTNAIQHTQRVESVETTTEQSSKVGEWIERIGGISKELFYQCSKCYGEVDTNEFDYCPWCGAKMKG